MMFLQQVEAEAKEMRKGRKATIKIEAGEHGKEEADQECPKEEGTPEVEKDRRVCFKQNVQIPNVKYCI